MSSSATKEDYEKFPGSEDHTELLPVSNDAKLSNDSLPAPVSAQAPRAKTNIPTAVIIPVWMLLSSSVILYNNHMYSTLNFRFPVFLVTFHLTFAVSTPRKPPCIR